MEFNAASTLCIAVAMLLVRDTLVKRVSVLNRFCIPAPVVGGLVFAIFVTEPKSSSILSIVFDTSLQSLCMVTRFTTIGPGASFKLIKLGGKLLVAYWVVCGFLALGENVIGGTLATIMDIHPLIGVMAGAVSMEGGHGAPAAYEQTG